MKTNARKGLFSNSSLRGNPFTEQVAVSVAPLASADEAVAFGMTTVSTAATSGNGSVGSTPKAGSTAALSAEMLAAIGDSSDAGLDIAAAAEKSGWGAGGNPAKGGAVAPKGGEGVGKGGSNPGTGRVGLQNPDRGPNQDGENSGKRPDDAGNPENGNGDGTGDGAGKPEDAGNKGKGDGTGAGDGESDRPAPAPTPPDTPLLDRDTVQYKAGYTFRVGDVTVGWDGTRLSDRPESLDLTTQKVGKDGTVLNPIDSEFGFYVTDFVGAQDKVYDGDFNEGWVGALAEGGIAVADSRTDVFSTPARLGTWLEGIGGNTVKASTEHYSVMQAILSDQAYPGDDSGYYQLDDDLKMVDYLVGPDGMPVDATGAPSSKLVAGPMHGFYIKELAQALAEADGGSVVQPPSFIDFSTANVASFQPVRQDNGDFSISADGLTLSQDNQSWEKILGTFTIADDTRLRFDFSADVEGEIHGIMFANGDNLAPTSTVQISGTQDWGLLDYADYVAGSGIRSYDIAIGELFTGTFDRMVFITDNDLGVGANSVWSNVALTDGAATGALAPIDFDRDGVDDAYNAFMTDIDFGGVTRNVAAVDIGNDGTIDYHDSNLNGFGIFGIQDILLPNESSIIEDIAVGDDYSVTLKDDGKLLYRWGNAVKRPNDIRVDAKIELPDEWKTDVAENDGAGDGFADKLYRISAAELVVNHTVTNNPNDQIRPEDFENEAAIGILPTYVEVRDPFDADGYVGENGMWQGNVLWVADKGVYAGDGSFLPSYFAQEDTGIVVVGLDGVPLGYYNPGGTVLRDFSLIDDVAGSTLAEIGALSSDLEGGFTEAYYTTMDREPFVADYTDDGTAYEIGPRWRLQPDKYGQDLPSVTIPQDITDPPPIQNGEEKYEAGADTTTVLNLLDWDGPSPLALSAGWMTGSGEVSVNGLNMTEDFDLAFYVKGDMKPVNLYGAELLMEYEEVPINAVGDNVFGTVYADTLIGRGDNTFDLSGASFQFTDARADLVVIGYGADTPLGLGFNEVFDFGVAEGDAIGLIGFALDPDNYNVHLEQEVVDGDLEIALDGHHFATLYDVGEVLGAESFYFA